MILLRRLAFLRTQVTNKFSSYTINVPIYKVTSTKSLWQRFLYGNSNKTIIPSIVPMRKPLWHNFLFGNEYKTVIVIPSQVTLAEIKAQRTLEEHNAELKIKHRKKVLKIVVRNALLIPVLFLCGCIIYGHFLLFIFHFMDTVFRNTRY